MHGDVSRRAQRTRRMGIGPIRMGVGDLHRAHGHHEENADQREEDSPGASGALSWVVPNHSKTIAQTDLWPASGKH